MKFDKEQFAAHVAELRSEFEEAFRGYGEAVVQRQVSDSELIDRFCIFIAGAIVAADMLEPGVGGQAIMEAFPEIAPSGPPVDKPWEELRWW